MKRDGIIIVLAYIIGTCVMLSKSYYTFHPLWGTIGTLVMVGPVIWVCAKNTSQYQKHSFPKSSRILGKGEGYYKLILTELNPGVDITLDNLGYWTLAKKDSCGMIYQYEVMTIIRYAKLKYLGCSYDMHYSVLVLNEGHTVYLQSSRLVEKTGPFSYWIIRGYVVINPAGTKWKRSLTAYFNILSGVHKSKHVEVISKFPPDIQTLLEERRRRIASCRSITK